MNNEKPPLLILMGTLANGHEVLAKPVNDITAYKQHNVMTEHTIEPVFQYSSMAVFQYGSMAVWQMLTRIE
ncbi:MAG: hypothetical protein ACJASB_003776 [Shewanella psychromarinicola]|jgi:hypothetical protein|uniref:hypothetical protein n=1 Tax=Shewanella psychromarinicola TaxID=2487742 RepID=UPI003EE9F474